MRRLHAAICAVGAATLSLVAATAFAATDRAASPTAAAAGPTASQLLAKTANCNQVSNGRYATDSEGAATVPICGSGSAYFWKADLDIDCDGISTSRCNSQTDPWYQPQTSFQTSTGQYFTSDVTHYFVVPLPSSRFDYRAAGIKPGNVGAVIYNGKIVYAVFADEGPDNIIGEASYATASALGINPDPANGGTDGEVTYIVFTGTVPSPVENNDAIDRVGAAAATTFVGGTAPTTPPTTAPTSTPPASGSGQITGMDGKCIGLAGGATANGTRVDAYSCIGSATQKWTVAGDGTIRNSGKCLDVASAGTADGTPVQIYDCNGSAAQQWTYTAGRDLVNPQSGKCLDLTGNTSADGTPAQIWSCTGGANQKWTLPGGSAAGAKPADTAPSKGASTAALRTDVAPGGNFDLSVWSLQLPIGSPGAPTTIPPAQLKGASGYTNPAYFWTDKNDGSMTFWAPEKGVTTPNSKYARSELREMNANGSAADWKLAGSHKLSATLRIPQVTKSVCVGQVHLGSGGPSTKPLLELYYAPTGAITLGTENSPDGGQTRHPVGNVPLGTKWSYLIAVSGNTIKLTVNGTTTSYSIPSSFNPYGMYFKAGSYNQSSSDSTSNGAKVKFYALQISHG